MASISGAHCREAATEAASVGRFAGREDALVVGRAEAPNLPSRIWRRQNPATQHLRLLLLLGRRQLLAIHSFEATCSTTATRIICRLYCELCKQRVGRGAATTANNARAAASAAAAGGRKKHSGMRRRLLHVHRGWLRGQQGIEMDRGVDVRNVPVNGW